MYRKSDRITITAEEAVSALVRGEDITWLEFAEKVVQVFHGLAMEARASVLGARIDLCKRLGLTQCMLFEAGKALAAREGWPESTPERLAPRNVNPCFYESVIIPRMRKVASRPCRCPSCGGET